MSTTAEVAFLLAMAVAAVCGGAAGRVFALEGENRRTSVLAAAYCGAGAGLLSGPLVAFAAVLVATTVLDPGAGLAAGLASAGGTVGPALLWGAASGAGGGFVVGILVAAFKRYAPRPR